MVRTRDLFCRHRSRKGGKEGREGGLPVALVRAFPLHACILLGYEMTLALLHDEDEGLALPPPE